MGLWKNRPKSLIDEYLPFIKNLCFVLPTRNGLSSFSGKSYFIYCLCFQKQLASSTVLTYMSAISFLLQLGGYEDLPGHFIISKALRGYHKEKAAKDSRLPITPSILKDLCQSLPKTCSSRFLQLMLHAMYLLAFHAFLRIGEITGLAPPLGNCLSVSDIKCLHGDSEGLEIHMSKFKHSTGKHIPVLFLSSNNR